jgi:sarcosine oxidase
MKKTYDFVVVGAGVFGAWIAHYLLRSGARVALLDAHGAANSRASSGGETRVIRMAYGPDQLYTRWSVESLPEWKELSRSTGVKLFHQTGVLWLGQGRDPYTKALWDVLNQQGVACEKLTAAEIATRYPQMTFPDITWGVLEPDSGLLMARKSVQTLVTHCCKSGLDYLTASALAPAGSGKLAHLTTRDGANISAGTFIFACGPWLPRLFPDLLGELIFPTRQEVFFLGPPSGNTDFQPPRMPVWLHHTHEERPYALPDIENRGFKIAFDRHGDDFDPETGSRTISPASLEVLRKYLRDHIPSLADAPVVETRVCQYENTWNGDFLIDRHPGFDNVWIAGGGSGHGFKHGPAVGRYVAARLLNNLPAEPRFALAAKKPARARSVY